jgi:hypothetical protein
MYLSIKSDAYTISNTAAGILRSFFFSCFCISWIFGDEFQMLCTQKNPLDSRRFLAMRSWVDLPDQSEPSTMMRVPGRSSVEKNISLLTDASVLIVLDSVLMGVLARVGVGIGDVFIESMIRKKLSIVNKI